MPVPPTVTTGELLRARDADLRLLLKDVLRGDAHIVVVGESLADQVLQLGFVVDRGPLLIAERTFGIATRLAHRPLREMPAAR